MSACRFTPHRSTLSPALPFVFFFLILTVIPCAHAADSSPWNLSAGVSLDYVDTTVHAKDGSRQASLDVDSLLSPFVKLGYGFTPSLLLEMKASLDIYSGSLAEQTGNGSTSLRGVSLSAGPTWIGPERNNSFMGSWRPVLHAGLRYGMLRGDLDYPVEDFKNAWGGDIAAGILLSNWEIRLTGTWITHDNDTETTGVDPAGSSDELDLSRIGLECAWHFTSLQ